MHALGVYLGILRSDVCFSQKKKGKKKGLSFVEYLRKQLGCWHLK